MSALTLAQPLHHPLARHPAALAEADTPEGADAPDSRSCGWFESSWDLQQGLAVSELPDSDSAVLLKRPALESLEQLVPHRRMHEGSDESVQLSRLILGEHKHSLLTCAA